MVVTQVKSGAIAALAGVRTGTNILQANRKSVKNAAEFKRAVVGSGRDKRLLLLVRNGDAQQYIVLRW